ncbi:triokinase/FMN cyclase-like isoform X2 [Littorina saxatilis]
MLAAVAMGPVFACPPASEMLAAIRAVGRHNPAGCLMLIPNYTGDRLNFGLAAERAQGEGIRIATHVIGEDCALTTSDKSAGRRGLTGIPVTIKIAGALAEEGRKLGDIVPILKRVLSNMASIGVALSPCFVPGGGPTFSLPHDEMELGLGVHGEAGVRRLKMMSARDTVAAMLDHMTSPDNTNRLPLQKSDRVAVFINDLGGISHMELNIVAKETIQYLESRGIVVVRALCSPFLTSLEMAGTHVTVLRVDDDVTRCLDAPTKSPHWPRSLLPSGVSDRFSPAPLQLKHVETDPAQDVTSGMTFSAEEGQCMRSMVRAACQAVMDKESTLNSLDTGAGDGDCGATLARGARGVLNELARDLPVCKPALLASRLAAIAESTMGGASGGLYGLFFTGVLAALSEEGTKDVWSEALRQGIARMTRYGGADPGDRTMLDALQPALDALTASSSSDDVTPTSGRFERAVLAAEKGAESTREMKARAGRASYVSTSLLQQPDAGAVGVATWLRAAYTAFSSRPSS